MITRLRQRSIRPVINHVDSGSILLALFAIMVLTSLLSVVLMTNISQQAKTRRATDFTFASQAADSAVNAALMLANMNGAPGTVADVNHWTEALPQKGVSEDFMWSWYSTPHAGDPSTLDITATGCRNAGTATSPVCTTSGKPRIMKAVLSGRVVDNAVNSSGEAAYVLAPTRNFNRALFADQDLIMQGSSTVTAYSSTTGARVPGSGQVATNGLADFGPAVKVDGIYMLNAQAYSSADRCNDFGPPNQCDPASTPRLIHDVGPKLNVTDTVSPSPPMFIKTQIDKCLLEGPLTAWVASKAPGRRLDAGIQCYSSMNFDTDTAVDDTTASPAMVYVTGPITIAAGLVPVKINSPSSTPAAAKLQIFSSGPVVSLGGGPTAASRTEVAWALWAPNARCASSKPTGFVTVYGAMVCQKIFTTGEFVAQWDEDLLTLWPDAGKATIWEIIGYEEGS